MHIIFFFVNAYLPFWFFSYKSRTQTEHGCGSLGDGLAREHPRDRDVDQHHGRHEGIIVLFSFREYFTPMNSWKVRINVGCLIIFVVMLDLKQKVNGGHNIAKDLGLYLVHLNIKQWVGLFGLFRGITSLVTSYVIASSKGTVAQN